ncbi:hypothetical protein [Luethyella okanaganae]|uniref:Uncharacterized protein n=1 Tax=Luethyella okanaganae TaxID=69372 RepID=A0ABW1VCW0_9MICO
MRWDSLFDDLESQLEHELNADEVDLRAEEERLRIGRLSLRARLAALAASRVDGRIIRLELLSGVVVAIRPITFGKDWLSGDLVDGSRRDSQCIVPTAAVVAVLIDRSGVEPSLRSLAETPERLADRIGVAFVLRDLCRRRKAIELVTTSGSVHGTIDRVGRDHLDLAVHETGLPRRESSVSQYRIVPLERIQLVRIDD